MFLPILWPSATRVLLQDQHSRLMGVYRWQIALVFHLAKINPWQRRDPQEALSPPSLCTELLDEGVTATLVPCPPKLSLI